MIYQLSIPPTKVNFYFLYLCNTVFFVEIVLLVPITLKISLAYITIRLQKA